MECPRCHNQYADHFYKINGKYYCRKCITFSRVYTDDLDETNLLKYKSSNVFYQLDFKLSDMQKRISEGLKENYINKKNSLVLAVCGSGKTEITFEMIKYALNNGDRVCFTTPRKELCIELFERFKKHFKNIDMTLLYGGHINSLDNQFVICTTHQLYRFEKSGFHLMVLDEADAFPFYNNEVLEAIFYKCAKGQYVKMSATIDADEKNEELFIMNRRYHNYDLPVPYIRIIPDIFLKFYIIFFLKKLKGKQIFIYVPLINDCLELVNFIKKFNFKVECVHSKKNDNMQILELLRQGKLDGIVTTTLLERGITVKDIQVIVYRSDHRIFNARTLIQIAGRVGRKIDAYDGKVCFLASTYSKEMKRCIYTIKKLNKMNA